MYNVKMQYKLSLLFFSSFFYKFLKKVNSNNTQTYHNPKSNLAQSIKILSDKYTNTNFILF